MVDGDIKWPRGFFANPLGQTAHADTAPAGSRTRQAVIQICMELSGDLHLIDEQLPGEDTV
jgi:hypothetical protein